MVDAHLEVDFFLAGGIDGLLSLYLVDLNTRGSISLHVFNAYGGTTRQLVSYIVEPQQPFQFRKAPDGVWDLNKWYRLTVDSSAASTSVALYSENQTQLWRGDFQTGLGKVGSNFRIMVCQYESLPTRTIEPHIYLDRILLSSETGRFTTFGTGCGQQRPALSPVSGSLPRLGSKFDLRIGNLRPFQPGLLFTGASDQTWANVSLPFALDLIGMPQCALYVSPDWSVPFSTGLINHYTWSVSIPSQLSLLGVHFYQQAFVLSPAANALGGIVSNAGKGVVGY